MTINVRQGAVLSALFAGSILFVCHSTSAAPSSIEGAIKADGSSTVYPITEAVAEEFGRETPNVKVTVGISGTGGGFKKFCAGETDFSNASRPIKAAEIEACKTNGVEYIELPVAYDALTVVVNPKNTWATTMTVAQLKKIWEPEAQGKIKLWSDVDPNWPAEEIKLFGPGVDSGTYDYFTEAVMGKEDLSRGDYTSSEDDNVLVQGVANNKGALGFFGLAYYTENKSRLKAVAIDDGKSENGAGGILPTTETVVKSSYQPLSRPLFVYVSKKSSERPEVKQFVTYYLKNAGNLSTEVGYVTLQPEVYTLASNRFDHRTIGSVFGGQGHGVGTTLEQLFKHESKKG